MRVRPIILCAVVAGTALGAAGCSSSGPSASGASSSGPAATSGPGASSGAKAPAGKPTGTVVVRSGGKVVCVITLGTNGTGTCKVNTANYTPGKVTFTGTYNSGSYKAANSSTTLTILPSKQTS